MRSSSYRVNRGLIRASAKPVRVLEPRSYRFKYLICTSDGITINGCESLVVNPGPAPANAATNPSRRATSPGSVRLTILSATSWSRRTDPPGASRSNFKPTHDPIRVCLFCHVQRGHESVPSGIAFFEGVGIGLKSPNHQQQRESCERRKATFLLRRTCLEKIATYADRPTYSPTSRQLRSVGCSPLSPSFAMKLITLIKQRDGRPSKHNDDRIRQHLRKEGEEDGQPEEQNAGQSHQASFY